MRTFEKVYYKSKFNMFKNGLTPSHPCSELEKQCALADLVNDEAFADCSSCIFQEGADFNTNFTLCNRCADLCVK